MEDIYDRLITICNTIPNQLEQIPDSMFSYKEHPGKWSKKEILGHLIDSAANNHQRFVRMQLETSVVKYDQNAWVTVQNYQMADRQVLINLWESYNKHLAYVINQIPLEALSRLVIAEDGKTYSLKFFINDYLNHLEYHLKQIVS